MGNHSADFENFKGSQTLSLASPSKFSKNNESTTANIRMLGESLDSSVDSRDSIKDNSNSLDSTPCVESSNNNLHEVRPLKSVVGDGGKSVNDSVREEKGSELANSSPLPLSQEFDRVEDNNLTRNTKGLEDSPLDSKNLKDSNKNLESSKDSTNYLKSLESKQDSTSSTQADSSLLELQYDWIMLELFDQMVRVKCGGEMQAFLDNTPKELKEYILGRAQNDKTPIKQIPLRDKITLDKISNKILSLYLKALKYLVPKVLRDEIFIQTSIGERHKWAYDSYSLAKLLESSGFRECKTLDFSTSDIESFSSFLLDNNTDGSSYKGSSLYMECRK